MFTNRYGELRSGWAAALSVLLYLGCLALSSLPLRVMSAVTAAMGSWEAEFYISAVEHGTLFSVVTDLVVATTTVGLFCLLYRLSPGKMGLARKGCLKGFGLGCLIGLLQMSLVFSILYLCGQIEVESVDLSVLASAPFWASFAYYVAGSVSEEITDRGYLMTVMKTTRSRVAVYVIPAVIFAMMHFGYGLSGKFGVFVGGILYAVAFVRTGKLWLSMGLHFAWNFTLINIFGLSGYDVSLITVELVGPDAAFSSLLVLSDLLVTGVVLLVVHPPEKPAWTPDSDLPFVRLAPPARPVAPLPPLPPLPPGGMWGYGAWAPYAGPLPYGYAPPAYGAGYRPPQPWAGAARPPVEWQRAGRPEAPAPAAGSPMATRKGGKTQGSCYGESRELSPREAAGAASGREPAGGAGAQGESPVRRAGIPGEGAARSAVTPEKAPAPLVQEQESVRGAGIPEKGMAPVQGEEAARDAAAQGESPNWGAVIPGEGAVLVQGKEPVRGAEAAGEGEGDQNLTQKEENANGDH